MDYKNIIYTKSDNIATITLNRPEKLNALNVNSVRELREVINEISGDNDIRVVILTGAGRGFCAGAELSPRLLGRATLTRVQDLMSNVSNMVLGLRNLPKPIIAAVNGVATGGGANLALACDIIIASEKARFGQVFINIGLHPDSGGTYFLPRLVGPAKACELMFTGKMIDGAEAKSIGMINEVVPAEQLETSAKNLALKLTNASPHLLSMIKASIYRSLQTDLPTCLEYEAQANTSCLLGQDFREAAKAFRVKRKANR